MNKTIRLASVLSILFLVNTLTLASTVEKFTERIASEQRRIDLLDGSEDSYVSLKSELQSTQATSVYLLSSQRIVDKILSNGLLPDVQKVAQLERVYELLKRVSSSNVHFYTQSSPVFNLIEKVQTIKDVKRLQAILKSNVYASLNLIAFFVDNPAAEPFFMIAARTEPSELLKHYAEFEHKPFRVTVLDEVAKVAPMKIKTYLHSWNSVHRRIKESENRITETVYDIFKEKGTATRSYVLLNDLVSGKLNIEEAHTIAKSDNTLFEYLIAMRGAGKELLGEHSVDEALKYQCLRHVRKINDLHEESDAVRFASLQKFSASEIYTLMVYSEDEIYTSTFLGMYSRMMAKMDAESTYQFLFQNNFNQFRTFIKMCAGYNELNNFLSKMGEWEKQNLFTKLVEGIEKANDNLSSAVAIADTYGSIKSSGTKVLFEQAILKYYEEIRYADAEAEKLYSIILSVFDIGGASSNAALNDQTLNLRVLPITRIYKEGKNIQQHFFFDDPDGRSSYGHFIGTFTNGNWDIIDKGTYVLLKSRGGKAIEIYANKPTSEYAGQDAIKAHFQETGRWPDVVVHRGHSYFASAAIESLTPNAEIVFLGSCGGYNAISQVLKYSPDAQIISSKQIGTMLVNDRLCLELNEVIRKGNDIVWDKLWTTLDKKFADGSTADNRFQDYIPPHKNLGALLIKTYRGVL